MSNRIIKDRQIVEDHWQHLADENEAPADGNIIVSFQRWQKQRDTLLTRSGKLGISIGDGVSAEDIKNDLQHFDLIAIRFPQLKDGRGYSYARLLRERYGYTKEIRATGNVLRDQLFPMARCGINAFELEAGRSLEEALESFNDFTVRYQPSADGAETPFSRI